MLLVFILTVSWLFKFHTAILPLFLLTVIVHVPIDLSLELKQFPIKSILSEGLKFTSEIVAITHPSVKLPALVFVDVILICLISFFFIIYPFKLSQVPLSIIDFVIKFSDLVDCEE